MKAPAIPANEAARLAELYQYDILDTAPEPDFDSLAELAAQICHCSTGAVTFIDQARQWIKGRKSCTFVQTPRAISFCGHTILQDHVLMVEDALLDERFCSNPLVNGAPGIRFYAGAPITSPAGYKVGSVCVIDDKPRTLSAQQMRMLKAIAKQAAHLLELRQHNQQLKTEANDLLSSERLTMQQTLRDLERERQSLGNTLHESMGQTLAAIQLHLDMADSQPELAQPCIQKARQYISSLLSEMRRVSYELLPVPLHRVRTQLLVQDLMKRLLADVPAIIELKCTGTPDLGQETALAVFRTIENAFQLLKQKTDIARISLTIKTGATVEIVLRDDGHMPDSQHPDVLVASNTMRNRIRLYRGTFSTRFDSNGMHTLVIALPVQAPLRAVV